MRVRFRFFASTSIVLLVASCLLGACSSSTAPPKDPYPGDGATTIGDGAVSLSASDYCGTISGMFCDFYLRCGRMVAEDQIECERVFVETCVERYKPRYVALESAGLVTLSRPGIDACLSHLASVACDKQWTDLAGPCGAMWVGASPAGAPCGIDVESFVCQPGTACILGLDFCGKCEAVAGIGETCTSNARCTPDAYCASGACKSRPLPGESCDDATPCMTGVQCKSGKCVAPAIVGEGAACDTEHRCAYRSVCQGGHCVKTSLLGEPCTADSGCTSGRCVSGTCRELLADGEACASALQCHSGQCVKGACAPLPSVCFAN